MPRRDMSNVIIDLVSVPTACKGKGLTMVRFRGVESRDILRSYEELRWMEPHISPPSRCFVRNAEYAEKTELC